MLIKFKGSFVTDYICDYIFCVSYENLCVLIARDGDHRTGFTDEMRMAITCDLSCSPTWYPIIGFIISRNCETQYYIDVDRTSTVPGMSVLSFNETFKNQSTNKLNKLILVDFIHWQENSHQQTTNFHDRLI